MEKTITHGALWAMLETASGYETERIWKRLEAGETVEYGSLCLEHIGYERIRVTSEDSEDK